MRKPASWMQLPIDDRILETLESSGLILSPAVIALNIDKSRDEVNRRLSVLVDHELVQRVKRGYYEITDLGEQYLEGELDASELDESTDEN
nr:transcriptional regulator [Natrinema saccharevitans]